MMKYLGHEPIKYRIWDKKNSMMTYLNIKFPTEYTTTSKIFLKDFSDEKDGMLFSVDSMWKLLSTQVETITNR